MRKKKIINKKNSWKDLKQRLEETQLVPTKVKNVLPVGKTLFVNLRIP